MKKTNSLLAVVICILLLLVYLPNFISADDNYETLGLVGYVYAGGTVQKVYKYWDSNLTKKTETIGYGGAINAVAQDEDYIYFGGDTTNKVYQCWKYNMTKKAESTSYGNTIFAICVDDTYVYVGGNTQKIYQYWKSNLTKKAEGNYGGAILAMTMDDTYIYCGGGGTCRAYQFWKSNMTKKAQFPVQQSVIPALANDATYLYVSDAWVSRVYQYWKSNTTLKANTTMYGTAGGNMYIYAISDDDTYIYVGGAIGNNPWASSNVKQYWKSNMTKKAETAVYGGIIYSIADDDTYVYAGGRTTQTVRKYLKSDMSYVAQTTNYGGTINAIILTTEDEPWANTAPSLSNEVPSDGSITQQYPQLNITVMDNDGNESTVYWYTNASGDWALIQTNTSVLNTTVRLMNFTDASEFNTNYWWRVSANDTHDNTTETYLFTTQRQGLVGVGFYSQSRALARTSDGTLWAVYNDDDATAIICSTSTDDGSTWMENTLFEGYEESMPTIAVDNNDVVYVFWREYGDATTKIKYCVYDGYWSSAYDFASPGVDNPAIAINSTNYVHVAWLQGGEEDSICEGWFNYYTDTISIPEVVASGDVANPTIAIDETDVVHVAWENWYYFEEYDESSPQIQYSYNDSTWSAIYNITEVDYNNSCGGVSLVVDGSIAHFIWANTNYSSDMSAYQYRNFSGLLGDIKDIYSYDTSEYEPYCSLSHDADNLYTVFDGNDEGASLLYSTYDGNSWSSPIFIKYVTDYGLPNAIFAQYPIISDLETNIPETGFAFLYTDWSGFSPTIMYYSNVTWQEPLPEYGDPTTFENIKMSNPQYPDPNGWDIACQVTDNILADDWLCIESGNVTDIHFWISTYEDMYSYGDLSIWVSGHSFTFFIMPNIPGLPFSRPDVMNVLWSSLSLADYDANLVGPFYGDEGWYRPGIGYEEHNHELFYRIDLTNFSMNFIQENGTIYWFGAVFFNANIGWKTTSTQFMDDAVWEDSGYNQYPLENPLPPYQSLDLAFVITGEAPLPSNYAPDSPQLPSPLNNTDYMNVYNIYLNCIVSDPDGGVLDVHFYWGNNTLIGTIVGVANNTVASLYLPGHWSRKILGYDCYWVTHDTTHTWYAVADDSEYQTQGPTWNFHTNKAWDLDANKRVNVLDLSALVSHYALRVYPPGASSWDINEDTYTNVLDVSGLVSHYGQIY